jgi:hypothetical protein
LQQVTRNGLVFDQLDESQTAAALRAFERVDVVHAP